VPTFGASLDQINELTDEAGIPRFGHTYLYDGGTGERFHQAATVGVMLKLDIWLIRCTHVQSGHTHYYTTTSWW
jgi:DNA-directed RNA polymerase beta subunit